MEIGTILALVIALAAVVVSFISVRTAKAQIAASIEIAEKQIRAQLVSANRQRWIETLRSHIVDLMSASTHLSKVLYGGHESKEELACLELASQTVMLHLDPNDELHKNLGRALRDLAMHSAQHANYVLSGKKTPAQAHAEMATPIRETYLRSHEAAQAVLRAESELIRLGE